MEQEALICDGDDDDDDDDDDSTYFWVHGF